MNREKDSLSLTEFQQNPSDLMAQLKLSGQPVTLTVDGKAEVVVQDARSYQRLHERVDRLETIEAVRQGIASANRGEGRPMDEVFDDLEAELRLEPWRS
jgi:prevent-host-death family protein